MEVSSHAIAMKRVWGLDFDAAVFTNLSREHLDFHEDMESYFAVKKRLFDGFGSAPPDMAVVNTDDPYGRRLMDGPNPRRLSFGFGNDADVRIIGVALDWTGSRIEFSTPRGKLRVDSCLVGRVNVYNAAAAVAVGVGLGISDAVIREGIRRLEGVPGRFERIDRGQAYAVVVDYAHTDDALKGVLETARELTEGKLIVVFGAGGERDLEKRERMGRVAAQLSDSHIVMSDNPRGEDLQRIIQMIVVGLEAKSGNYSAIPDRREAIRTAVGEAGAGDTVVIAGKGHETTQIIGRDVFEFDDRAVAGEVIDEAGAGRHR